MTHHTQLRSKPLQIWDSKGACVVWATRPVAFVHPNHSTRPIPTPPHTVQNGQIQRITDEDIQSSVLEIVGTNVSTNYIHCPGDPKKTLGIRLPYLVLILKNVCGRLRGRRNGVIDC